MAAIRRPVYCIEVGMSTIKEGLEEADMVRVFRFMNGHNKIDKTTF